MELTGDRIVFERNNASFSCSSSIMSEQIQWLVNSTSFEKLALSNFRIDNSTLHINDIPLEQNSTTIQCAVNSGSASIIYSNKVTLLVQGKNNCDLISSEQISLLLKCIYVAK